MNPTDSARAEADMPLDAAALFAFVGDIERLFRLNPHLEITSWQATPGGFRMAALNDTNDCNIATELHVDATPDRRTISLTYTSGLKQTTTFSVEAAEKTARLVISDYYPQIEDAQDPRLTEVDRSLIPWVAAIRKHLLARARWGRVPGWHWWSESFLLSMSPRQRRIVRLIIWVTGLEFVAFLFVFVIYWMMNQG